jgi:ribose/xylose/arabinose/galactoside ABC-type transport system permease subunit
LSSSGGSPSRPTRVRLPALDPAAARLAVNAVGLLLIIAVLSVLNGNFLTAQTATDVLRQVAAVLVVGGFFTMLMVAGGIDLSVGGVLALAGIVSVSLSNAGVPVPIAFVVAVAFGGGVGLLNGLLVALLGVNALIVTLGSMYVTRGIALVFGEGRAITAVDPGYSYLGTGTIGPVPLLIIAAVAALGVALLLEKRTLFGRYAILTGTNPRGARMSGIPTRTTIVAAFAMTGAAAGWAGVLWSSRLNSAVSKGGMGFEFEVIIAALVGGTSLFGGEGTIFGMILGALIVGTATTGMNILGVDPFVQRVLLGLVLLAAVSLDALVRARRERPARRNVGRSAARGNAA